MHHSNNLSSICSISRCRFPGNFRKTSWKFRQFTFWDWLFSPEIYFLRLVYFPGNLLSQTGFYFPEISLSDRLLSGERTTGHGNFLRIFLLCTWCQIYSYMLLDCAARECSICMHKNLNRMTAVVRPHGIRYIQYTCSGSSGTAPECSILCRITGCCTYTLHPVFCTAEHFLVLFITPEFSNWTISMAMWALVWITQTSGMTSPRVIRSK
jgi:hypothetical protein